MRNKLHPAKAKWTGNYVHLFRDVTENQKALNRINRIYSK